MTSCLNTEFFGNFPFKALIHSDSFFSSVCKVVEKFAVKSVWFFSLCFFLRCLPSRVLVGLFLYPWNFKSPLAVTMGWFLFLIYIARRSICRFESFFSSVELSITGPSDTAASTTGPAAIAVSYWRRTMFHVSSLPCIPSIFFILPLLAFSSLWSGRFPSHRVSLIPSPKYFLKLSTSLHPNYSHANRSSCF